MPKGMMFPDARLEAMAREAVLNLLVGHPLRVATHSQIIELTGRVAAAMQQAVDQELEAIRKELTP